MRSLLSRATACSLLLAAVPVPAFAERAVQAPSASTAAPTATPAGMEGALVYGGDFASHLQGEVTKSDGNAAKATVFDDTDSNLYANYSTWLSLYANLHLERNRQDNSDDYYPKANSAFRSEGLTLRQLFAAVRPSDDLTVYGGKIHPNFGWAYASVPGNFYNFASDYEQSERIGLGVEYTLPAALGLSNARVSLEAHYLDTSFLSTSLFSQPRVSDATADRPWRYRPYTYGAGNTGSLDNWTLALRGGQPEAGVTYQLSYEHQETADPAGKAENGGSVGVMYDPGGGDGLALGHRLGVVPFVEYAQFSNFGGSAGEDARYLTGGLAFHYVRWELDVSAGLRKLSDAPQDDGSVASSFDRQENISLNYTLSPYPEIVVGAGLNHINVAGKGSSWGGGPSLSYNATF